MQQEQFKKFIDPNDPTYQNFDDKEVSVSISKLNKFIACPLCAGE